MQLFKENNYFSENMKLFSPITLFHRNLKWPQLVCFLYFLEKEQHILRELRKDFHMKLVLFFQTPATTVKSSPFWNQRMKLRIVKVKNSRKFKNLHSGGFRGSFSSSSVFSRPLLDIGLPQLLSFAVLIYVSATIPGLAILSITSITFVLFLLSVFLILSLTDAQPPPPPHGTLCNFDFLLVQLFPFNR